MGYGEYHMVIRTRQQVSDPIFHPLVFLGRPTERAVPVATAMVLGVGMPTVVVVALVAMIAESCGVAAAYAVDYCLGVGIFGLESTCAERLLEACTIDALHPPALADQKERPVVHACSFAGADRPWWSLFWSGPVGF